MNEDNLNIKCELISDDEFIGSSEFDFDKIIFDLNSQIDLLSNKTDCLDYIVAIASGIVCGILDILWVPDIIRRFLHDRSVYRREFIRHPGISAKDWIVIDGNIIL